MPPRPEAGPGRLAPLARAKPPADRGPGQGQVRPWARPALLVLLAALFFSLPGCGTIPTPQFRLREAEQLASAAGWQRIEIAAPPFVLSAWVPEAPNNHAAPAEALTIYIEGDGLAWQSGATISPDPTPINPLALRLALRQPGGKAAYLARPGQFRDLSNSPAVAEKYWTSHRFAPEVIAASDVAVTRLRALLPAASLRLVGYSGGGAVAALLAARRPDVAQLITVAGNLDLVAWTAEHRLTPLSGSLNPADFSGELRQVPQVHLLGAKDRIVGEAVARSFQARFPSDQRPELVVFPNYDHHRGWVENWPEIYESVVGKKTRRGESGPE